ncbi:MAG: DUF1559 domain-containing protein [Thermoguttaceae bacterium]
MVTQNRQGFTLVELLVVIVIISMLIGLLVPAVQGARERARQVECMNNQKNLASAVNQYEVAKKRFPGYLNVVSTFRGGRNPDPDFRSWVVPLLPYLGRNDLWEIYRDTTIRIRDKTTAAVYLELTVCPSNTPESTFITPLAYVVNCGMVDGFAPNATPPNDPDFVYNGVFHNRYFPVVDVTMTDIKDGAAATLMISEHLLHVEWAQDRTLADQDPLLGLREGDGLVNGIPTGGVGFTWQLAPDSTELDSWQINEPEGALPSNPGGTPQSRHPAGVIVAFCDGHTQFLGDNIHYLVYQHLMTPDSKRARSEMLQALYGPDPTIDPATHPDPNLKGTLSEGDYK